jgi:hypothetical protein
MPMGALRSRDSFLADTYDFLLNRAFASNKSMRILDLGPDVGKLAAIRVLTANTSKCFSSYELTQVQAVSDCLMNIE